MVAFHGAVCRRAWGSKEGIELSSKQSIVRRVLRLALLLISIAIGLSSIVAEAAEEAGARRIALLIANSNYPDANAPLLSASKDAALLAGELSRYGFDTSLKQDLSKQDMLAAVESFVGKIVPGSVAVLYYNGIGIQTSHQTYLIPVNAEIWSEADVKRDGIGIEPLLADMNRRGAKVKIVILDASRRNPFERRFRAYSGGLAGVDAPDGSLIMYSAAPNKITPDGSGSVSLFMNELVKELRNPDTNAEDAMTHTRVGVSRASNGEQVPWVASSLVDPFYFGRGGVAPAISPPKASVTAPATPAASASQAKPVGDEAAPAKKQPDVVQTSAPGDPQPGAVFRDCADCPDVVVLANATFDMGSAATPFDRPIHRVTLAKPFAIGRTAVTFAMWGQCITDGGCKTRPDNQGFGEGDRPVINVGWSDAKDYVAWLSNKTGKIYRLPSEAEWEYAAHGGTTTPFSWGDKVGVRLANCLDCGIGDPKQTLPVKSFPANNFGLYDMAGNVAEWVEDCWNLTYKGAPRDGSAWLTGNCSQRVLRGGSFDSSSAYIRPSARFRYDADVRYWANGFRVVREVR